MTSIAIAIAFGVEGNSAEYLAGGWSAPEPGYTWTMGTQANLVLPDLADADHLLTVTHNLFLPPGQRCQRVAVSAGESLVARYAATSGGRVELWLPRATIAQAGRPLRLSFALPDAARPSEYFADSDDSRLLALCFVGLTLEPLDAPPRPPDLSGTAMRMESLGANCAFGLVQRQAGAEPLGLLRFATSRMASLTEALDHRFEGLGAASNIDLKIIGEGGKAEWMVIDRRYGFVFHTHIHPDAMAAAEVLRREARRLPWLANKLLDDLTASAKLFVYQGDAADDAAAIQPLIDRLRAFNPRNRLLLALADPGRAGTVEARSPDLLVCYLEEVAALADPDKIPWRAWEPILQALQATGALSE